MPTPHLLVFGPGYSATAFMNKALADGWRVSATARTNEANKKLIDMGVTPINISQDWLLNEDILCSVTHILTSIAPDESGDPVLINVGNIIEKAENIEWIGYLSATNVYGDFGGNWVDENTIPQPTLQRGIRRLQAEKNWQDLGGEIGARTHIFRLAGIYGPGRNPVLKLIKGTAKRVHKPGHIFSRIHVDDIGEALWKAANSNCPSMIFNLADDDPREPDSIIEEAAKALNIKAPPLIDFDKAEMSDMARSFYRDNKRVRNNRIKEILGLKLKFPTFTSALSDLIEYERNEISEKS